MSCPSSRPSPRLVYSSKSSVIRLNIIPPMTLSLT
jgi:hypothetical protein